MNILKIVLTALMIVPLTVLGGVAIAHAYTVSFVIDDTVEGNITATASGGFSATGSTPQPPIIVQETATTNGTATYEFYDNIDIENFPPAHIRTEAVYEPGTDLSAITLDTIPSDIFEADFYPSDVANYNAHVLLTFTSLADGATSNPLTAPAEFSFVENGDANGFFFFTPLNYTINFIGYSEVSDVPEPSTFLLLGAGLAGVGLLRRRFKK